MNVALTPELEKIVAERIASGRYASASEVIAEALRLLDEHDQLRNRPVSANSLLEALRKSGFIGMWKTRSDMEIAPISPVASEHTRNGAAMIHKCTCSTPT